MGVGDRTEAGEGPTAWRRSGATSATSGRRARRAAGVTLLVTSAGAGASSAAGPACGSATGWRRSGVLAPGVGTGASSGS